MQNGYEGETGFLVSVSVCGAGFWGGRAAELLPPES